MSLLPRWTRRMLDTRGRNRFLWEDEATPPPAPSKPRVRITHSGWVRHSGGSFPFDPLTVVETVHADGLSFLGRNTEYAAYWPDAWWKQEAESWRRNIRFYRIIDDIGSMASRLPPVLRR